MIKILINPDKNSMIIRGSWQKLPIEVELMEESDKVKTVKFLKDAPVDIKYFIDSISKLDNNNEITIYLEIKVTILFIAILQKIVQESGVKITLYHRDEVFKNF